VAVREHVGDEVSIEPRVFRPHERGSALAQPQHDHLHPRGWGKVGPAEAVHDSRLEPRLEQDCHERPAWLADEPLRCLVLDHQVGILGWARGVDQAIDDGGCRGERDVGEDLVWLPREHDVQDVGVADADE